MPVRALKTPAPASTSRKDTGSGVNKPKAKAVATLYDINNVDTSVQESGKQCMQAYDTLVDKLEEYAAADSSTRQQMTDEISSLYSDATSKADSFQQLVSDNEYNDDSNWNVDTKQYALDVVSYVYQQAVQINEAYMTVSESNSGSDSSSASSTQPSTDSATNSSVTNTSNTNSASEDASSTTDSALYDINKVDPSVKAFGDEYEQFVDQYVSFMQRYNSADSATQASMINDYSTMMQQYGEVIDKVDDLNSKEDTFDTDTYQYWIDLYSRCSQKMLEAAS